MVRHGGVGDQAEVEAPHWRLRVHRYHYGAIHVLKGKVLYWIAINPPNEQQEEDLAASVAAQI